VSGLSAVRLGDDVRLRWDWPPGAGLARVAWWPRGQPGPAGHADGAGCGQHDLRLRRYIDDGGAQITVGRGPVTIGVRTVVRVGDVETESLSALIDVAGRRVEVGYSVVASGLRRRIVVTFMPEQSCRLPPIVVVGRTDGVLPLTAAHGTIVATLAARDAVAGQPTVAHMPATWPDPAGLACFVDPASSGSDGGYAPVTLVRSRRNQKVSMRRARG
jgi:hypothetical protein